MCLEMIRLIEKRIEISKNILQNSNYYTSDCKIRVTHTHKKKYNCNSFLCYY